jgi:thymidylate synthase
MAWVLGMFYPELRMTYATTSEAYLAVVNSLLYSTETIRSAPRGQGIREFLYYQFTVDTPSWDPIQTLDPERNSRLDAYTKAEFLLYQRCEKTAEEFGKASKFWLKLANPDGTVNSAYGWLLFADRSCGNTVFEENGVTRTPWEWARLSLLTDKDTRQAIVKFHKREHLWVGNKDQVCTLYANFHIRNDKLHMVVRMRSNDVILGLPFDMPYFCHLQERMRKELLQTYPNLQLGTYTHSADSFHLYDRDVEKAYRLIGHAAQIEIPNV